MEKPPPPLCVKPLAMLREEKPQLPPLWDIVLPPWKPIPPLATLREANPLPPENERLANVLERIPEEKPPPLRLANVVERVADAKLPRLTELTELTCATELPP